MLGSEEDNSMLRLVLLTEMLRVDLKVVQTEPSVV